MLFSPGFQKHGALSILERALCSCHIIRPPVPLSVFKSIPWLNYLMKM